MTVQLHGIDSLPQRFFDKIDVGNSPSGCWLWTASKNRKGYGQFGVDRTSRLAHKISYELTTGPVPEGYDVDHLCRDRACVNPLHLEAIPHRENVRRGRAGAYLAERTHCPKGHPYEGENLMLRPDGRRRCRTCERAFNRAYRARVA